MRLPICKQCLQLVKFMLETHGFGRPFRFDLAGHLRDRNLSQMNEQLAILNL